MIYAGKERRTGIISKKIEKKLREILDGKDRLDPYDARSLAKQLHLKINPDQSDPNFIHFQYYFRELVALLRQGNLRGPMLALVKEIFRQANPRDKEFYSDRRTKSWVH